MRLNIFNNYALYITSLDVYSVRTAERKRIIYSILNFELYRLEILEFVLRVGYQFIPCILVLYI